MRRPIFALVPHRGMVWSGVSRAALTVVRDEDNAHCLLVTVEVVSQAAEGGWVPGELAVWVDAQRAELALPQRLPASMPDGTRVRVDCAAWRTVAPGSVSVVMNAGRADLEPDRDGRITAVFDTTTITGDRLQVADARGSLLDATLEWDLRMRLDWLDGQVAFPEAHAVEVHVDVDASRATFSFCGTVKGYRLDKGLERVAVAVVPRTTSALSWAELPRAAFHRVAILDDLERGEPPSPLSKEELESVRYSTWDLEEPPAKLLGDAESSSIMAALAQGDERSGVLDSQGLDAYEWAVEELATAMALAAHVEVPDDAFAAHEDDAKADEAAKPWSPVEAFAASFSANAAVPTARLALADFVLVKAQLETGDTSVLRLHELTEASFAAEEDAWASRAELDPEVALAVSEALDRARKDAAKSLEARVANWTGEPLRDVEGDV